MKISTSTRRIAALSLPVFLAMAGLALFFQLNPAQSAPGSEETRSPNNAAPTAFGEVYTTAEDTVLSIPAPGVLGNDTDVETGTLTATVMTAPGSGSLALALDGSLVYTPALNYNGTITFSYQASDGELFSTPAVVTLVVTSVNDIPVAGGDVYTTAEDTVLSIPAPGVLGNDSDVEAGVVTATLLAGPETGTLQLALDGSLVYTPALNYNGTITFSYRVSDGELFSTPAVVTVDITSANDIPVAVGDVYTTAEDTVLSLPAPGVLGNDSDIETGVLTATLLAAPVTGTLQLALDGSLVYTPALNYNGTITFSYRTSDGELISTPAVVTLVVTAVNDAPIAYGDFYTYFMDTPLVAASPGILGNDIDVDLDVLSVLSATLPVTGSLDVEPTGGFVYTPTASFSGTVTFTYRAADGWLFSGVATTTLVITGVNDAPIAVGDVYTTGEDTVLVVGAPGVLLNDIELDSQELTAILVTPPMTGSLALDLDGSLVYTPVLNYNGVVTFSYQASDGWLASGAEVVTITISPQNDVPVAVSEIYTTAEDTVLSIPAPGVLGNDTDVETASLTATLLAAPVTGTLNLALDGSLVYTPVLNYNGVITFSYRASDGELFSTPAVVTLVITSVNDIPLAVGEVYTTAEDTVLTLPAPGVLGNDSDVETSALAAVLQTGPVSGSLALALDGSLVYTPALHTNGVFTFSYQASDGVDFSNLAVVTLVVTAVNDIPLALGEVYTTAEDTVLSVPAPGVLGNDTDVETAVLTPSLLAAPVTGNLYLAQDGGLVYTPALNYNGVITFSYQASDGVALSIPAVVILVITSVNDIPLALGEVYTTAEDTVLSIPAPGVLGNDSDVETEVLTATLLAAPVSGTLNLALDGSLVYTPALNYNGVITFSYRASDGVDFSPPAVMTVAVTTVNDVPLALGEVYTTSEDTVLTIPVPGVLANDSDFETVVLTATLLNGPVTGTLQLALDGSLVYTPALNYNGVVTFSYQASDGALFSAPAVATLVVTAVNDAPVAFSEVYTYFMDTPLVVASPGVLGNEVDVDLDVLTVVSATLPVTGSLALESSGGFVYTPTAGFSGTVTFTYQAADGGLFSGVATTTLVITGVNDAPIAVGDVYTTGEDTVLVVGVPGVLQNDMELDAQELAAILVTPPMTGSLALSVDGSLVYTPVLNYNGVVTFSYQASDGWLMLGVGVVTITVSPVNDVPVASGEIYTTAEDTVLIIPAPGVLGNDSDVETSALTATLQTGPASGSLELALDGSLVYTPALQYNGVITFSYRASDGDLFSFPAVVTLVVTAVNDIPLAYGDTYTTAEDTVLSVSAPGVLGNDSDVEMSILSATLLAAPVTGTLDLSLDGSLVYTPALNFNGVVTFSYQTSDGELLSTRAVVTLVITAVNDIPLAFSDVYTTAEDTVLSIPAPGVLGNDTDVEPGGLTAVIDTPPTYGSVDLASGGGLLFTPTLDFNGIVTFSYQASDGDLFSLPAVVTIVVTAVNDAPVAVMDVFTTAEDTVLIVPAPGVLGNDSDVDLDTLQATWVSGPSLGSLVLGLDGGFVYTPTANFYGVVAFQYQAEDAFLSSTPVTVTIFVTSVVDDYTISVIKSGNGSGLVTSCPTGISCGAACMADFPEENFVTLTAIPDANSVFSGWEGSGCPGTGSCVIEVVEDTVVTATFSLKPDVWIEKSVFPEAVRAGQPVTFTLAYGNIGPMIAYDVVITDIVPSDFQVIQVTTSGPAISQTAGITYSWEIPSLAMGESGVITISTVLRQDILDAHSVENRVVITTTTPELDSGNNQSAAAIRVIGLIYVDDSGSGANTGQNWSDAFTSFESALAAALPGDEVWVAAGFYLPTNRTISVDPRSVTFGMRSDVTIYGGFAGFETSRSQRNWEQHLSILSGDLLGNDGVMFANTSDNAYHVVSAQGISGAVLDGFTVRGGNANSTSPNNQGGSLYITNSDLEAVNLVLSNSQANFGGGLYSSAGQPVYRNLTFIHNLASNHGGGAYLANHTMLVDRVLFFGNRAYQGAGVYLSSSDFTLVNGVWAGNFASGAATGAAGAGLALFISDPTLVNLTIHTNVASGLGNRAGGINNDNSHPVIVNAIIWDNFASQNPQIRNINGSSPIIRYSIIKGSGGSGTSWLTSLGQDGGGNLDIDPQVNRLPSDGGDGWNNYVNNDYGDLRLAIPSPGIDSGRNAEVPAVPLDAAGQARIYDVVGHPDTGDGAAPLVDRGAYEAQYPTLFVTVIPAATEESIPATGVITRTGAASGAVIVTLSVDAPTLVTVPLTITLPDGVSSLTFPVVPVDNWVIDGDITVTLQAAAPDHLPATTQFTILNDDFPSDLQISKSVTPSAVSPGEVVTYTLVFTNSGDTALGIVITDVLPAELELLGFSSQGVPVTMTVPGVWQTGVMDFGEVGTITLTMEVTSALKGAVLIENGVEITHTNVEIQPQDNVAQAILRVRGVIYVDHTALGASTGSTWQDAFTTLQEGLDFAIPGDEIWVAQGVYTPIRLAQLGDPRSATFELRENISIYGGFTGVEENRMERDWAVHPAILSGDLAGDDLPDFGSRGDNAYHVVTAQDVNGTAGLDGFTLSGGNADGSQANGYGGGLLILDATPMLAHLIFSDNLARLGGGMYTNQDLEIDGFQWFDNQAIENGGGLYIDGATLVVSNGFFQGNTALIHGGGMYADQGVLILEESVFKENHASLDGGGGYTAGTTFRLVTGMVMGNQAGRNGGGWYASQGSLSVEQAVLAGNMAASGGGLYLRQGNLPLSLAQVSVAGNEAGSGGGLYLEDSFPSIINSVLWGNAAENGPEIRLGGSSTPIIRYSLVAGSGGSGSSWNPAVGVDGGGNLAGDPDFELLPDDGGDGWGVGGNDDYGDLRLGPGSAALDAGSNPLAPPGMGVDLAGEGRYFDIVGAPDIGQGPAPVIDIGAYEAHHPSLLLELSVESLAEGAQAMGVVTRTGSLTQALGITITTSAPDRLQAPAGITISAGLPSATFTITALQNTVVDLDAIVTVTTDAPGYYAGIDRVEVLNDDVYVHADMQVDMWAIPAVVSAGDMITYLLVYTNAGPGLATGILITVTLPERLLNGAFTASDPAIAPLSGSFQDWQLPSLIPGAGGTITITAEVSSSWIAAGVFTATAEIRSELDDLQPDNNNTAAAARQRGVIFVDSTLLTRQWAAGAGTGTSWQDAFISLQPALDAWAPGDEIWVAEGVYLPEKRQYPANSRSVTFMLENQVIYGGFLGTEATRTERDWTAHPTILSGDLLGNDGVGFTNMAENAYHVLTTGMAQDAILDGFIVRGGNANGLRPDYAGGGIFNDGGSPTLTNLRIEGNRAELSGGGMYDYQGNAELGNFLFIGNQAGENGGGLAVDESSIVLNTAVFSDNLAVNGAGAACQDGELVLAVATFSGNDAGDRGGGLYALYCNITVSMSQFEVNHAEDGSGGYVNHSAVTLRQVIFTGNQAAGFGGGWYASQGSLAVEQAVLVGNTAVSGGGLYLKQGAIQLSLAQVSLAGNGAESGGGLYLEDSSPAIVNSVLWGNAAGSGPEIRLGGSSAPVVRYSLVAGSGGSGGSWNPAVGVDGGGNLAGDPDFDRIPDDGGDGWGVGGNDDYGDLRLGPGSAALDAGSNLLAPVGMGIDLAGEGRYFDIVGAPDIGQGPAPVIDMGAYEAHHPSLLLELSVESLAEGAHAMGVVTRTGSLAQALGISLTASAPGVVVLPEMITIQIGQVSVGFELSALDDAVDEADLLLTVTAAAEGYVNGEDDVLIIDDDETPIAATDVFTGLEDTLLALPAPGVLANDTDGDNDPLQSILVEEPAQGTLELDGSGGFVYTPTQDFTGIITFSYQASDLTNFSLPATVTLVIVNMNDVPIAVDDVAETQEDTPVFVDVLQNDHDIDPARPPLVVVSVTAPAHGTAAALPEGVVYTPTLNYSGDDIFMYVVSDGALTDTAKVTVTVIGVNDPPEVSAGPDQVGMEGQALNLSGSFTDPEGGVMAYSWDFGDGNTVTIGLAVVHAYLDNGVFTATLTITDAAGGVGQDHTVVEVSNAAPVVEAGPDQSIVIGAPLQFTGSYTDPGTLDTHVAAWNFGDLTGSASLKPIHAYLATGEYTATLTVEDDDGGVGTDTLIVTVTEIPSQATVDSVEDDPSRWYCTIAPDDCSLRGAILLANENPGAITTILLPAGTYTLTLPDSSGTDENLNLTGDLDIRAHLTIRAEDENGVLPIVQAGESIETAIGRVFHILPGFQVTLHGLEITHGSAAGTGNQGGGGILNQGNLHLEQVIVSQSQAAQYGGGILNDGVVGQAALTVTQSTINNNQAQYGGGIASYATFSHQASIVLENATLSANQAVQGGGVYNWSVGGTVPMEILHSTIARNIATIGGGVFQNSSSLPAKIKSSLIGENTAASGGNCWNASGGFTSLGWNLDSDNTCGLNQATDRRNFAPALSPLGYYGGRTPTHVPLPGSPAIDWILIPQCKNFSGAAMTLDQRGVSRPIGTGCDVGAVERIDEDGDKVDSGLEDAVPGNGDGNGDSILDRSQQEVVSFPNLENDVFITMETGQGDLIMTSIAPQPDTGREIAPSYFIYGIFEYTVDNLPGGALLPVTFIFHTIDPALYPSSYWKQSGTAPWWEFTWNGTTGTQVVGNSLVVWSKDGGRGDLDGIQNGEMTDRGAPAVGIRRIFLPLVVR